MCGLGSCVGLRIRGERIYEGSSVIGNMKRERVCVYVSVCVCGVCVCVCEGREGDLHF